jgi:hypothetical protein
MQWRTTPQASSYWRLPSKETARLQAALRDSATRVSSTVYRSSRAISHITSRSFRPRSQKWVLGQFDCGGNLHKKSRPNKLQLRRPYSERREASGYSGAAIDEDDPDHQLEDGQGTGDHGTSAAARPRRRGHRIGRSTSGIGRFCCRSRLKASANNDSLTLTRSAAGTGHDGSVGAGPRTAVLFVLP